MTRGVLRFIIDDASWSLDGQDESAAIAALEALADRLETARGRDERVARTVDLYEAPAGEQCDVATLLFTPAQELDHDVWQRVRFGLDRCEELTFDALEHTEAQLGETTLFAPAIVLAHQHVAVGHAVACLPLPTAGRRGPSMVDVDGTAQPIHFVTNETEHRAFFRDAVSVEDASIEACEALCRSAFPDLTWVEGVWNGAKKFSQPFRELRSRLFDHLGALDDHGARIFREGPSDAIGKRLTSLLVGGSASDENGETKQHTASGTDRTRRFEGADTVFWWHTKLQSRVDRVHFKYLPGATADEDRVVIGIFTDHCKLPN